MTATPRQATAAHRRARETWSEDVLVAGDIDAGLGTITGVTVDAGRIFVAVGAPRNQIVEYRSDGATRLVAGAANDAVVSAAHAAGATLSDPIALASRNGTLYVFEARGRRVRAIAPDGSISTVVGTGAYGSTGDGGPATAATIQKITAMAFGPDGSLYLADSDAFRVRRVSATGTITTFAGTGIQGFTGDGGAATSARIEARAIAVEASGSVLIGGGQRVRRVSNGLIATVAGGAAFGSPAGDGGPATAAALEEPVSIAAAPDGSFAIASVGLDRIRRVSTSGIISTIAGGETATTTGDGGPAAAAFVVANHLTYSGADLLFSDRDVAFRQRVRRITAAGIISSVAPARDGASDGGSALSAWLNAPSGAVGLADGTILVTDTLNNRVRQVLGDGTIATFAGTGDDLFAEAPDGAVAATTAISAPQALVLLPDGTPCFSTLFAVRCVNSAGLLSTLTTRSGIESMTVSAAGVVFVGTRKQIFRIGANGALTLVAGTGASGTSGDGGLATLATFTAIAGIAAAPDGSIKLTDDTRIRSISSGGIVSTIAGSTSSGNSGDGGPATAALLQSLGGIVVRPDGTIVVATSGLRQITPTGIIQAFAGGGSPIFLNDGRSDAGGLTNTRQLSLLSNGDVLAAGRFLHVVRRINTSGVATTVAGMVDGPGSGAFGSAAACGTVALARASSTRAYGAAGGRVSRIDAQSGRLDIVTGYLNVPQAVENAARFAGYQGEVTGVAVTGSSLVLASTSLLRSVTIVGNDPRTWPITAQTPLAAPPMAMSMQGAGVWWTTSSCVMSATSTTSPATVVAGSCTTPGYANGAPTAARFNQPEGIAVLADGTVYVSDTRNHRVRRIRAGTVTTIAGSGTDNNTGAEGSIAASASISLPRQLAVDSAGHLYIAAGDAVRMIADDDGDGIVDGGDRIYTIYDGGRCLRALALMDNDRLWVADACDGSIVELER